ncbi:MULTISPECIES: putative pilus assembly protein FilE [Acinetobacter]|uniref:Putative pilus assembly protein FilE n=1 Tax=Acinetobacter piscicola TaxID=2006115 RepID=A0A7S6VYC5_9GAMM|nr:MULTISPECIES: putative pilus assembly protein FilE [Acinetobacter]QOW47085.1 putative pilus assembly protein FilE [Acinetobacter piscicola]
MRLTLIFLAMSIVPVTYAANFYTIIGPDGRPMVVQKPIETEKKEKIKVQVEQKNNATVVQTPQIVPQTQTQIVSPTLTVQPIQPAQVIEKPEVVLQNNGRAPNSHIVLSPVAVTQQEPLQSVEMMPSQIKQKTQTQPSPQQREASETIIASPVSEKATTVLVPKQVVQQGTKTVDDLKKVEESANPNRNITEIDGVQYVNNEYLEEREFNLEGKKRFYVMPETGGMTGGRFETVERQKGLSKSLLDRIRQPKPLEHKPIVLATTYYRLPKEEVVKTLEQACFTGKKMDKAKTMSMKNQEVSFFPVAPIKENFSYEVVKLDPAIQNILFSSFASSQKKPSYYWPLAVFLDEKGCVVEGVSGFKNEEQNESSTHYASLEGVLKKPDSAHYLFMTPLSQAIDIQNHELTNQGQIKLSVIQ